MVGFIMVGVFLPWRKNVDPKSISKYAELELFFQRNSIIDISGCFIECWLYKRILGPIFRSFQQFCDSQIFLNTSYSEKRRTQIP